MLASLGLYVVLQNVLSLSYGDEAKSLRVGEAAVGIPIAGARLATSQAALAVGSTCAIVIVWLILKYTRFGKAIRAVSSDSELAAVRGIDVSRTILGAFALGSGLVGLVGILMGLDVDLVPTMGLNALMMGVVAMIVGGARSTIGICIGGLMLGLAQNLGVWKIGSGWQDSIAFLIMVVFVLLRPQGVIGRLPQKSNV